MLSEKAKKRLRGLAHPPKQAERAPEKPREAELEQRVVQLEQTLTEIAGGDK